MDIAYQANVPPVWARSSIEMEFFCEGHVRGLSFPRWFKLLVLLVAGIFEEDSAAGHRCRPLTPGPR
jgi:hypothetical protein